MSAPLIIGIAGLAGSGKSIFSDVATSEFAFIPIRPGIAITLWLEKRGLAVNAANERLAQIQIRSDSGSMTALMDIAKEQILHQISCGNRIIIDSMCSFDEIACLKEIGNSRFLTIAIHAPMARRVKWIAERNIRPYELSELQMRDELEIDCLQKGKLLALADHHLSNNSGKARMKQQSRSLIAHIAK